MTPRRTILNLENKSLGDKEVKALVDAFQTNTTLTELNLAFNNIKDGVEDLATILNNTNLLKLRLYNNYEISSKSIIALANSLADNPKLTELDLTCIGISVPDRLSEESIQHLMHALLHNTTLTSLSMGHSNLTLSIETIDVIAETIRQNNTLNHLALDNMTCIDGARILVDALESNATMTGLSLTYIDSKIEKKTFLFTTT